MSTASPERMRPRSKLLAFLRLRASQSPRVIGWILTASRWLGVTVYDTAGSYIFLITQTPEQTVLFEHIVSAFGDMNRLCDENGRDLRLVIIPNEIQLENHEDLASSVFDPDKPNREILAYCSRQGIPCLDLLPLLRREYERSGEPLYFRVDRHFNQRGTALSAAAIAEFLERVEG